MDKIDIRHQFTITDPDTGQEYTDTLYYDKDNPPSDKEIEILKQERFDNWKQVANTPPPEPTKEQLQDLKAQQEDFITQIDEQIAIADAKPIDPIQEPPIEVK